MESSILSIRIERRWPLLALAAVALAWAAAVLAGAVLAPPRGAAATLALLVGLLPPLALGLAALALLPGAGRSLALAGAEDRLVMAGEALAGLNERLAATEAGLAGAVARAHELAAVLPGLDGSATALVAAAAQVAESSDATRALVDAFGGALPALARTVGEVDATLRAVGADSAVQLRAVEATLQSVQARRATAAAEADAAIADMTALLARIDEASTRNAATLSKRAYALDAAVDGVLARATAAVDHMRDGVAAQLRALDGGMAMAGRQLTIIGDDGARLFNQRLEMLLATSRALTAQLAGHEAGATRLQALVDDARERVDTLVGPLAAVAERLAAAGVEAAALGEPVAATQALVEAMAATASGVDDRLAGTRAAFATMEDEAGRLVATVGALRGSVGEGAAMIGEASAGLAAERAAIIRLGEELAGHFEAAHTTLVAIGERGTALAEGIDAGLGAGVERAATAGERAAAAFGAPVRSEIDAIEAAAARAAAAGQEAAARLAGQLLRLAATVDTVEARVREVETDMAVRDRNSLAGRSAALIRELQAAAVDVAKLLAIEPADAERARQLGGDRGVLARALAVRLDDDVARQIAGLFESEPRFRADASRYCELFEALLLRLAGDGNGDADGAVLATMALSSDIGRVYGALAGAAGRAPPAA